jgi:hypothetical protein
MADSRIKKVIINKASLPALNGDLEKYVVRYRVISEDRNRISHWSPQFYISPNPLIPGSATTAIIVKVDNSIVVTWPIDDDSEVLASDVFVAWGTQPGSVGSYEYHATVTANSTTIPIPSGKVSVDVKIQLAVYPRKLVESRIISESGVQALV